MKPLMLNTLKAVTALGLVALLSACSGGAPTETNPITNPPQVNDYTGPAPSNADVQAFKLNLWENIKANNRCGGCHHAGGQAPEFARNDDVNIAYNAANTVVNLTQPDQSRMVAKVAGGHNCWLASASACGDTLTVWIRNWAGASATGGTQIQLQAPPDQDVGASKSFPDSSALFASTIYPVLHDANKGNCVRCHSASAATPQSPFFASNDVDEAYAAAKAKINLDTPAQARFVLRLRDEFHNCWTTCGPDSNTMQAAVEAFAGQILVTAVDPTLVVSKSLSLYQGTVASGGNRYDTNLIALYEFKTGTGNVAYDTSGVEPAANLSLSGDVAWVGGWGINIRPTGKAQASTVSSRKFATTIKSSGEYTIEAWVANANVAQEDAYIVSYSGGTMSRNVTLSQRAYQYEAFNRSDNTGANGDPSLLTLDTDRDAQASLQHVVLTYDPVNGRRLYVNGVATGDIDAQGGGSLKDWDDSFALVLGNETSTNRQWQGVVRLVAIHSRALTLAQIQQNFAVGVGERYFMLFNVSNLTGVPQGYVMLEASQNDSYSYLFTKPTFISLDPNASIGSIPIKGLRIGVNGAESRVGQAYIPLDTTVSMSNYVAGSGQQLSKVGTIIGLEKGPASDQFFLSFEQIGSQTHTVVEPPPPPPAAPVDAAPQPDIGVRTFDEINQSMSNITGVPITDAGVAATFAQVKQQLPTVPNFGAFLASHQTGIAQLAIKYCAGLVGDAAKRAAFFPGLDVSGSAAAYFGASGSANRGLLINPLLVKGIGTNLPSQPDDADVSTELDALITKLANNGASTATVTKAVCAAVLGSAAVTVQ